MCLHLGICVCDVSRKRDLASDAKDITLELGHVKRQRRLQDLSPSGADGTKVDEKIAEAVADAAGEVSERRDAKRREAEERNARYRAKKKVQDRLDPIEAEVAQLETLRDRLQGEQADPSVYSDPARAREVAGELDRALERLDKLYAEWEKLAGEL